MAKIELKISVKKADADETWLVIDNMDVALDGQGRGACSVDSARPKHKYLIWVEGPALSSASLEIKQGAEILVKSKPTVAWGNSDAVEHNEFACK